MTRLYQDSLGGRLGAQLLIAGTTMDSPALAAMREVLAGDEMKVVIDPDGRFGAPDTVTITAHTTAATTATITRGSSARQHEVGTDWVHTPLAADMLLYASGSYVGDGANPKTVVTGLSDIWWVTVIGVGAGAADTAYGTAFKGLTYGLFGDVSATQSSPRLISSGQKVPIIVAGGSFQVDDGAGTGASLNFLARTYEWAAFGRA